MKIVVLGAYGYTGKLVCQVLTDMNIEFTIAGRELEKLKIIGSNPIEVIDILNRGEVVELVSRYDIFVNCIGPFGEYADLLLQSIVRSRKYYLDLTGESVFVQKSYEKYHNLAKANKALILHSCAFESVLADLMFTKMSIQNVDRIQSYYQLGKAKPSPGTRLTMKLSKFSKPYFYQNGQTVTIDNVGLQSTGLEGFSELVAVPYPLPEICFFKWRTDAKNIGSYLLVEQAEAKFLNQKSDFSKSKVEVLAAFSERKPKGPKVDRRKNQKFTLVVEATNKKETQTVILQGHDMYWMTAKIVSYFVQKIINKTNKSGVLTPSQFLGNDHDFFETLALNPLLTKKKKDDN